MTATKTSTTRPATDNGGGLNRATLAGSVGNLLEQYDSVIYAFSAVTMSKLFFPQADSQTALLLTFGVFAVGFLARPLGAVVFGHFGDRYGRRSTLLWSVALMAFCTVLIGLLPTYAVIGVTAPVLLTVVRFGQGIATAGETAGSATFIVEHAPPHRRGYLGSFQQVSSGLGFLAASGVTILLSLAFTTEQIEDWAWRLPFLLGLLSGLAALWIRLGVSESPAFEELKAKDEVRSNPLRGMFTTSAGAAVRSVGFISLWATGYYLFLTYIPTFLQQEADVAKDDAQLANLLALTVFVIVTPAFGALSDRIGRRPLLLTSAVAFLITSVPIMMVLSTGNTPAVYGLQILLAVFLGALAGPGPAALAEMFPAAVRFSAMSLGWNVSNTLFGGTAPFIATFLVGATGLSYSPAFLGVFCAPLALLVFLRLPETAKKPLL
jgi:MFS transporter, MHS family, proline/betaine transporter